MNAETNTQAKNGSNGNVNGHAGPHSGELGTSPAVNSRRGERAARSFVNGRVVTFIYAYNTTWGEVEFRVEQARLGLNGQLTDRFRSEEVSDMIRGAYDAKRWINQRQRHAWWSRVVAALL